ncbi:cytochrome P450 [Streptomyces sp. ASQP_92]|uniref:cytochrome P450 n=1 Tax=Streptomyces sp. ASQP_92 TaxID=2979116 RepID=UPI0021C211F6|nr:cytochrome P450 [Streptomyces sp. ASQP_92]MCT9089880.1 cytochrome P450 [Streptomyces sp. ASQP_92]
MQNTRIADPVSWPDLIAQQVNCDTASEAYRADPNGFTEPLRSRSGPVHRTPSGALVLLGHAECAEVLRDPRFGHGAATARDITAYGVPARSFLLTDPPDHDIQRGRVSGAFTARAGARLAPRIEQYVHELAGKAWQRREVDVVADLARPLAASVLSDVLGLPPGYEHHFVDMAELLVRGMDPQQATDPAARAAITRARTDFVRTFTQLLRRAPDDRATSVIGQLARGIARKDDPVKLSEAVATCGQLIAAGYETTVGLIANGLHTLLTHPEESSVLDATHADADAMATAVEELLRFEPPVHIAVRTALTDARVGGTPVPRGTILTLMLNAANRDPLVYPDPHRLDLRRGGRNLAFGLGAHFCLGAPLARMEAQLMLSALWSARPVLVEERVTYTFGFVARRVRRLRIRLTRCPVP